MLTLNRYGNIDCRASTPVGYTLVKGMSDSDSDLSRERSIFWGWVEDANIEHCSALVGFTHQEAQYFARAHFGKPTHYRPMLGVLIPSAIVPPPEIIQAIETVARKQ